MSLLAGGTLTEAAVEFSENNPSGDSITISDPIIPPPSIIE